MPVFELELPSAASQKNASKAALVGASMSHKLAIITNNSTYLFIPRHRVGVEENRRPTTFIGQVRRIYRGPAEPLAEFEDALALIHRAVDAVLLDAPRRRDALRDRRDSEGHDVISQQQLDVVAAAARLYITRRVVHDSAGGVVAQQPHRVGERLVARLRREGERRLEVIWSFCTV